VPLPSQAGAVAPSSRLSKKGLYSFVKFGDCCVVFPLWPASESAIQDSVSEYRFGDVLPVDELSFVVVIEKESDASQLTAASRLLIMAYVSHPIDEDNTSNLGAHNHELTHLSP
jgi:hypothetical protein